jgi:Mrp family chromosome partitioning ATPase
MGEIADALRRARELEMPGLGRGEEPRVGRSAETEALRPADRQRQPAPDAPRRPRDARELVLRSRVEKLDRAHRTLQVADGPALQASRQLAVRLREELAARGARTVAVVSAVRGEGKTMVACNLAVALASLSQGSRVAILDLDLRSPMVGRVLGVSPATGVEAYLSRGVPLEDVGIACESPPLDVFATARLQANAHELLVTARFVDLMAELRACYPLVLVDTPPTLVVPDVSIVLPHLDACLPVARCGVTRVGSFRQLLATLPERKVVGEVMNEGQVASYTSYTYGSNADAESDPGGEAPARSTPWRRRRSS